MTKYKYFPYESERVEKTEPGEYVFARPVAYYIDPKILVDANFPVDEIVRDWLREHADKLRRQCELRAVFGNSAPHCSQKSEEGE